MKKWGFTYAPGDSSALLRTDTLGSAECTPICVGVSNVANAPDAAQKFLAEGVRLIELCGAFSGGGLVAVVAAINNRVPVGAVFYGGDAGAGLHRLFG